MGVGQKIAKHEKEEKELGKEKLKMGKETGKRRRRWRTRWGKDKGAQRRDRCPCYPRMAVETGDATTSSGWSLLMMRRLEDGQHCARSRPSSIMAHVIKASNGHTNHPIAPQTHSSLQLSIFVILSVRTRACF